MAAIKAKALASQDQSLTPVDGDESASRVSLTVRADDQRPTIGAAPGTASGEEPGLRLADLPDKLCAELRHHIRTMYPDVAKAAPVTFMLSVGNVVRNIAHAEVMPVIKRLTALEADLEMLVRYCRWTISDESPGHHPTLPSAVAKAAATLNEYGDYRLARRTKLVGNESPRAEPNQINGLAALPLPKTP